MLKDVVMSQFGDLSEGTHGQPVTPSCFRVSVENTAVVPPRGEALVAGKIIGQNAPEKGASLTDALDNHGETPSVP